jgi:hypothetical protein
VKVKVESGKWEVGLWEESGVRSCPLWTGARRDAFWRTRVKEEGPWDWDGAIGLLEYYTMQLINKSRY